jgi:hypothetical protein
VGGSGSESVKLVFGQDQSVSVRYLALSHCWGSQKQHPKFCTNKSDIKKFRNGIRISSLPRTFQDAVFVTRSIGVPLLWIDSLCILQDDPEDWIVEASLMGRVFSSAYCTLAASCASGSSEGFLKPRSEGACIAMRGPGGEGTYYVCEPIDNFTRDVDESKLNHRGWVLQERALSRRTIHFTQTQSYWQCGKGVRCETMTKMNKYVP